MFQRLREDVLTQMGTIRLGKRTDNRTPLVRDFVPLSSIDDLVFGAWDIFPDNCYQSALKAGVVDPAQLEQVRAELESLATELATPRITAEELAALDEPTSGLAPPRQDEFRVLAPETGAARRPAEIH